MVVDKHIKFTRLIPIIWKRMLVMTLLVSAIVIPLIYFDKKEFTIGMTTPLILGTAISIFLGFRTNSAYERWFKGRSLFSEAMSGTRNLALILARNDEPYKNRLTGKNSKLAGQVMPRMIRRSLAYIWMLGKQLKDLDPFDTPGLTEFLSEDEIAKLRTVSNPAMQLLFNQEKDFRIADAEGQFIDGEHFEFVAIQRDFARVQTECEGLKNTNFPTHYTFFTNVFVWLLVVLLSLSLPATENSGYYAIPLIVIIGWIFSMIEGIGAYMDYPWINNRNVVPTDFLARNLERDVRQFALGETELPPVIEPIDGALY